MNGAADIIAERAEMIAQAVAVRISAEPERSAMLGMTHVIAEILRSAATPDLSLFAPLHERPEIASRLLWAVAWTCIEKLCELLSEDDARQSAERIRSAVREALATNQPTSWPTTAVKRSDSDGSLRASISRLGDAVVTLDPTGRLYIDTDEDAGILNICKQSEPESLSLFEFFAPETAILCEQAIAAGQPWAIDGCWFDSSFRRHAARFAGTPMGPSGSTCQEILVRPSPAAGQDSTLVPDCESVLKHIPIGIISTDKDGAIASANGRAVAMIGSGEAARLDGQLIETLLGDSEVPASQAIAMALKEGKEGRVRFIGKTPFGMTLDCDLVVNPLRDPADGIAGLELFLVDAPSQTALSRKLLQTEKLSALGEIVAGVAHELNNPLTGILGYAQLIQSMDLDEKTRSRFEQISIEAQRCRKIVQGLLGFSRYYDAEKVVADLNEVLSNVVSLREYQLRVDSIELALDLAHHLPNVEIDQHEMQRVFLNIINNAQQALSTVADRTKRFKVRSWESSGEVCVSFEDNGPGIPPEHQTKIFDPFFSTKDVGEGTGLGLSVAYGVVRDHGGRIDVETKAGNGTTFTLVLPVSQTDE